MDEKVNVKVISETDRTLEVEIETIRTEVVTETRTVDKAKVAEAQKTIAALEAEKAKYVAQVEKFDANINPLRESIAADLELIELAKATKAE